MPASLPAAAGYQAVDFVSAEPAELKELLSGVTHVFHLAGASSSKSSEEEMVRNNVDATERLFEAVVAAGTVERALYMSSTSVYGEEEQLPSPVPENVDVRPSRSYGKAKWATEEVVWRYGAEGLPVVVLYAPSVDGVYHDIDLLGQASGRTAEAETLVADMRADIDAVAGAVAGATKPRVFYEVGYTDTTGEIFGPADASFVAEMVALAGGDPITTGDSASYLIPLETLIQRDPEVITLGREGDSYELGR